MSTDQELFDVTVRHLFAQGSQSADNNGSCLYRGPHGASCAVGCHVPDDLYDRKFEGTNIHGLVTGRDTRNSTRALKALGIDPLQEHFTSTPRFQLLLSLQVVHDERANWSEDRKPDSMSHEMRDALIGVASRYCLSSAVVDELANVESAP